jgi:hypothetical protein
MIGFYFYFIISQSYHSKINKKNKFYFFLVISKLEKVFLLTWVDLINHLPQLGNELATSLSQTQLTPDSATHLVEGSVHFCLLSQAGIKNLHFFDILASITLFP